MRKVLGQGRMRLKALLASGENAGPGPSSIALLSAQTYNRYTHRLQGLQDAHQTYSTATERHCNQAPMGTPNAMTEQPGAHHHGQCTADTNKVSTIQGTPPYDSNNVCTSSWSANGAGAHRATAVSSSSDYNSSTPSVPPAHGVTHRLGKRERMAAAIQHQASLHVTPHTKLDPSLLHLAAVRARAGLEEAEAVWSLLMHQLPQLAPRQQAGLLTKYLSSLSAMLQPANPAAPAVKPLSNIKGMSDTASIHATGSSSNSNSTPLRAELQAHYAGNPRGPLLPTQLTTVGALAGAAVAQLRPVAQRSPPWAAADALLSLGRLQAAGIEGLPTQPAPPALYHAAAFPLPQRDSESGASGGASQHSNGRDGSKSKEKSSHIVHDPQQAESTLGYPPPPPGCLVPVLAWRCVAAEPTPSLKDLSQALHGLRSLDLGPTSYEWGLVQASLVHQLLQLAQAGSPPMSRRTKEMVPGPGPGPGPTPTPPPAGAAIAELPVPVPAGAQAPPHVTAAASPQLQDASAHHSFPQSSSSGITAPPGASLHALYPPDEVMLDALASIAATAAAIAPTAPSVHTLPLLHALPPACCTVLHRLKTANPCPAQPSSGLVSTALSEKASYLAPAQPLERNSLPQQSTLHTAACARSRPPPTLSHTHVSPAHTNSHAHSSGSLAHNPDHAQNKANSSEAVPFLWAAPANSSSRLLLSLTNLGLLGSEAPQSIALQSLLLSRAASDLGRMSPDNITMLERVLLRLLRASPNAPDIRIPAVGLAGLLQGPHSRLAMRQQDPTLAAMDGMGKHDCVSAAATAEGVGLGGAKGVYRLSLFGMPRTAVSSPISSGHRAEEQGKVDLQKGGGCGSSTTTTNASINTSTGILASGSDGMHAVAQTLLHTLIQRCESLMQASGVAVDQHTAGGGSLGSVQVAAVGLGGNGRNGTRNEGGHQSSSADGQVSNIESRGDQGGGGGGGSGGERGSGSGTRSQSHSSSNQSSGGSGWSGDQESGGWDGNTKQEVGAWLAAAGARIAAAEACITWVEQSHRGKGENVSGKGASGASGMQQPKNVEASANQDSGAQEQKGIGSPWREYTFTPGLMTGVQLYFLWLGYFYLAAALRENVLLVNGSHIKAWWIQHHCWSASCALLMLGLPVYSQAVKMFCQYFLMWSCFQALVMMVQNMYQRRRMYTRIAMGKNTAMDVVTGESSGTSGQLLLLYPLLFVLQGSQFAIGAGVAYHTFPALLAPEGWFDVEAVGSDLRGMRGVCLVGVAFCYMAVRNFGATVQTVTEKRKVKYARAKLTSKRQ